MSLGDVVRRCELDQRSGSHSYPTAVITSRNRILRFRSSWCIVIFVLWTPDPRIADEASWLPHVHTNERSRSLLDLTDAIKLRNRVSRFRDFHCRVNKTFQSPDSRFPPLGYLSRNFYRSDSPRSFGKFVWDPTVTESSSFFFCKFLLRAFSSRLFLLSCYFKIPTGFYPSYSAVSTVAINDNNHHCILSTEFANI